MGEGDSEKPDWYWNGLGFDEDHPRRSAAEPLAPADSHHDVEEGSDDPEEDAEKDDEEEDASDEVKKPIMLKDPGRMTVPQFDEHCATGHLPHRSNCDSCISGMGKEDPHQKGHERSVK